MEERRGKKRRGEERNEEERKRGESMNRSKGKAPLSL